MRTKHLALALSALALTSLLVRPPALAKSKKKEAALPGVVDESALDRRVDPCDDFYQFACGNWIKNTPIPPDRPQWSRGFSEIAERNLKVERDILDRVAGGKSVPSDRYPQKLGDYYATCMDEQKAETASLAHLKEQLSSIEKIDDPPGLAKFIAHQHEWGGSALFDFGVQQDFKDATQEIGVADQGGLGLPDRDYYLKTDKKSEEIRANYIKHVENMLVLAGESAAEAKRDANVVMTLETALAKASMSRVDRRDPNKIYHRLERSGLEKAAPRFLWGVYFTELGIPEVKTINVAVPEFFAGLDKLLSQQTIDQIQQFPALRAYLRWHLVDISAAALGDRFVAEDFHFRSENLTGEKQILPRWKRCVIATDHALGEALGAPFVAETFGKDGKDRSRAILDTIEMAFQSDLDRLDWMDAPTKQQALEKLHKVNNKIGYPDKWRNYDKLVVDRSSYLANLQRANAFEAHRQLDKIGKPVDKNEWLMTPPTVNAYYEASLNEMVFPAGILQPPFFNRQAGDPTNYGGIGMVMGHELTHGFDDEGRRFDGLGNLREWWTPEVGKAFEEKAECVAKQYDNYTAVDDVHINGHLTLGEDIADLGGIKLAWSAQHAARKGEAEPPKVAGFDADQQFFLSFAQSWCTNRRDALSRMLATVDPHAPPKYRVNGVLVNTPDFAKAFSCKAGSRMAPEKRCAVW